MEARLTMVSLGVHNLKKATHFYENVLGWEKTSASNEHISFFKLNGILLGLYGWEPLADDAGVPAGGQGFRGVTLAHNARSKEEVDDIFTSLDQKKVRIVKPPQDVFWGGYSGYFADPDGHLWEVAWNPYLSLDKAGNVTQ